MSSNLQVLKGKLKDSSYIILDELDDLLKSFSELELKELYEYTKEIKDEKFRTSELLKKDETIEYYNCVVDYAALVCILRRINDLLEGKIK